MALPASRLSMPQYYSERRSRWLTFKFTGLIGSAEDPPVGVRVERVVGSHVFVRGAYIYRRIRTQTLPSLSSTRWTEKPADRCIARGPK